MNIHFLYQSDSIFRPFCFINGFVESDSKLNSKNLSRLFNFSSKSRILNSILRFNLTNDQCLIDFFQRMQRSEMIKSKMVGSKRSSPDGRLLKLKWKVAWKWTIPDHSDHIRDRPLSRIVHFRLCLSTFTDLDYSTHFEPST